MVQQGRCVICSKPANELCCNCVAYQSSTKLALCAAAAAVNTWSCCAACWQGYYCMNLKVTIVAFSGLVGKVAAPVTDLHSTTQVKPTSGDWMAADRRGELAAVIMLRVVSVRVGDAAAPAE
jgi:hypothetical protein